jgi:hypothetical protein
MTLLRVLTSSVTGLRGRGGSKTKDGLFERPKHVSITTRELKYDILMKTPCKLAFWRLKISVLSKRLKTSTPHHMPENRAL